MSRNRSGQRGATTLRVTITNELATGQQPRLTDVAERAKSLADRLNKWSTTAVQPSPSHANAMPMSSISKANISANSNSKAPQKPNPHVCICDRETNLLQCSNCQMLVLGRVSEVCLRHRNFSYLMDFTCCPFCQASRDALKPRPIK